MNISKFIIVLMLLVALLIGVGCVEEQKTYTEIHGHGSYSTIVYDYHGNYLRGESDRISAISWPYTDYEWSRLQIPVRDEVELLSPIFNDINHVEIEYDAFSMPASDEINRDVRFRFYTDGGYAVCSYMFTYKRC